MRILRIIANLTIPKDFSVFGYPHIFLSCHKSSIDLAEQNENNRITQTLEKIIKRGVLFVFYVNTL